MKQNRFRLTVNVLVPRRMTEWRDCQIALSALCECETLRPEYFDVVEPIREPFDRNRVDAVIDTVWRWQKGPDTFMWRRRKPPSWGGIYMSKTPEPTHGTIDLEATGGTAEVNSDVVKLSKALASPLRADFGVVDVAATRPDGTESCLAIRTRDLRKGLPDLYWGTIFGKPYIELFGSDRISSIPAAVVTELAPELFYIQLTERLNDVVERPEVVDDVRRSAKLHLGLDAFVSPDGIAARVPVFSFAAS